MTKVTAPRTRRRSLSRERIAAVAAELLDREGAEALSTRRLASKLGCEAMSLYHHVSGVDELLDLVVDHALAGVPLPADGRDARAQLGELARAYLGLATSRPHAFRLVSTRRWRTPAAGLFQGRMLELLVQAGATPRAALRASRVLIVYLNGAGLAIEGRRSGKAKLELGTAFASARELEKLATASPLDEDMAWGLDLLLAALLPRRRRTG